ncbi:MAG: phosphoribosylformylglycinamidine synthase subunit PurL [Chloroflexi bacterium]|nr:phosphoribosylformylglycinamidine synthase subunit PurL [Chloroflexota bacterium]
MPIYRFVVRSLQADPRPAGTLAGARAMGFGDLQRVDCRDLYFIEGQLSQEDLQRLALELLADPVTQSAAWDELPVPLPDLEPGSVLVEVSLRPGVTDPAAEQLLRAAHEMGLDGVRRAATGLSYLLHGPGPARAGELAGRLLANPVIQRWAVGVIEPSFPEPARASGRTATIRLSGLGDEALLAISQERRAALDLAEMKAIQAYCREEQRDLTDVEFETIAQTWSEHCVHKTFKAQVVIEGGDSHQAPSVVDSLIGAYLKSATQQIAAPWVLSAFVDNAGIIAFDDEYEVSFKVETHNHPSAIEPFGGANTGVGGVIRDILGVGAKPIAATDVLCFGLQDASLESLPAGVLHPRRIRSGVVAGVQDYGNKIGIPTVNGAILYAEGYTANPLVFCGCVGIAPKGKHRKQPQAGDRVVVLGGRTGRDGLRGATFSSMPMDAQTGEVSGASVQIGDPVTEKGLIDVILRARDAGLYHDITDCGAGGLSSAVGEMAAVLGAEVDLGRVRLKYPGLAPWEVWLSEAQERMALAVPPGNMAALEELCETFDTEITDIGAFSGGGRLVVRYDGRVALDLDNRFLHEGVPQRQLKAVIQTMDDSPQTTVKRPLSIVDVRETLLNLLSSPNIASKAPVIRLYDHEVQGGTVVKPLVGVHGDAPSDAAALKPIGTKGNRGIVLSNGINPEYGQRDPYRMAWSVVDEAIRNAAAVGADPARIALLDNFCWGDPNRLETMGSLVEAARGCHDAAIHFGTPFISGKDSLNNEYLGADGRRHAIPPTLLISAIGIIHDVDQAVTMDLKAAGNIVYLLGQALDEGLSPVPQVPASAPAVYRALHQAIRGGLVRACHDLSEGGLAVAAAEMCIGGRLGLEVEAAIPAQACFRQVNGCLLAEVAPGDATGFEGLFNGLPCQAIGRVDARPCLQLAGFSVGVEQLVEAFNRDAGGGDAA